MSESKSFSRRIFLKKTGAGAGLIGAGAYSSNLITGSPFSERSGFDPERRSPREVKVICISRSGLENDKDIIQRMIARIRTVSVYKPDIICLPEVINGASAKEAEEVPGPTTNLMSAVAKEYGCYIICPIHTKTGGRVFNSAILIDRKGLVAGKYNKIHPVSSECERGVTPGNHPPPVFKTDFGTIGILICFDVNWTEEWRSLKNQGVEIVFWPSAFPGGRMLPSLAWMFKFYVAGASWRDPATIYDMTGDLIASSGLYEHWAAATLNLEKVFLETVDYHRKIDAIRNKYGSDVNIKYYHDEDWIIIESCSPNLRIIEILKEYDLVPHWDYIKAEENIQDRFRNLK